MNTDYREHLPSDFNPESRVWIYQSNRLFSIHEALEIEDILKTFINTWNSHGTPVTGYANLFFGQFIIMIADEKASGLVSGCSTDSSVRVVKDIEQLFNVHLFDRLLLAFLVKERVQMVPMAQLPHALENDFIPANTLYFNNTVQTLAQLRDEWLVPIQDSWIRNDSRFATLLGRKEKIID